MAFSRTPRSSKLIGLSWMKMAPVFWIETDKGGWLSLTAAASVLGNSSGTPAVSSGAEIMKMMSSTSITSTKGVTLISDKAERRPRRLRRPRPPLEKASWVESAKGQTPLSRRVTAVARSSAKASSRAVNLEASVEYLL